jgi:hypothetical protein
MSKNYEISNELRQASAQFLKEYSNYEKCLQNLDNQEKLEFTEDEVNEILNLLGAFRLRDVFSIVERYKIEVLPLKAQTDDQSESTTSEAE